MQIDFLTYFEVQAAANNDFRYLLSLDLLLANVAIDRQESREQARVTSGNPEAGMNAVSYGGKSSESGERNVGKV